MKICPNCNSKVDESYNFCPACGYDLQKTIRIHDSAKSENTNLNTGANSKNKIVLCDVCGEETPVESGSCESCGALLTGKEKTVDKSSDVISEEKNETLVSSSKAPVNKNRQEKISEEKKAKPAVQIPKQQKQKPSAEIKETAGKQAITPVQTAILIVGLLAVGLLILDLSGMFDSKPQAAGNVQQQNQGANGAQVSLEQLNTINALENEVRSDSSNTERILQLAHLLNDSGLYDRAIGYYKMYLRRNPDNADAIVDMGVCYYSIKDYINAKNVMLKGLSINPKHQIASFNLGIVSLSAGNIDSAKIWWQKAINLNPDSEIGKKAKELLNSH